MIEMVLTSYLKYQNPYAVYQITYFHTYSRYFKYIRVVYSVKYGYKYLCVVLKWLKSLRGCYLGFGGQQTIGTINTNRTRIETW